MCDQVLARPSICKRIRAVDLAKGRKAAAEAALHAMTVVANKHVSKTKSYLVDEAMVQFFSMVEWTIVVQSVVSPTGDQ